MRRVLAFDVDGIVVRPGADPSADPQALLVPAGLLAGLSVDFELLVFTARSRPELQALERSLDLRFARSSTGDELAAGDPEALLSLLPSSAELVVLIGTGEEHRRLHAATRFHTRVPLLYVEPEDAVSLLEELRLEPWDAERIVREWGGG